MFFFWGPFFFLFPLLIIFLVIRAFTGFGRPHHRDHIEGDDPYDLLYGRQEEDRARQNLHVQIYKLAYTLGGKITVSDIVVETGLDADEAEELIQSMVDNQRVRMEIQDDGLVIYEFPEILRRLNDRSNGKSTENSTDSQD
jgi:predicted transcriptional regulator